MTGQLPTDTFTTVEQSYAVLHPPKPHPDSRWPCCEHCGCTGARTGHDSPCDYGCNDGGHLIRWTIRPDAFRATVTCQEPEHAPCQRRCTCAAPTVGDFCATCGAHFFPGAANCNPTDWIAATNGWLTHYDGPDTALRDGPITFTWSNNRWTWHYV